MMAIAAAMIITMNSMMLIIIDVLRLNQLSVWPIQAMKPICCPSQNQSGNAYRVGRFRRPDIHTYFRLHVRGKLYCAILSSWFDIVGRDEPGPGFTYYKG